MSPGLPHFFRSSVSILSTFPGHRLVLAIVVIRGQFSLSHIV